MEPPKSWDRLTATLAVCDLSKPFRAWAFLVLQGLVRDLPGDRENFLRFVQQERGREITGPSLARRIAILLARFDLTLPASDEPDPEAESALQRLASVASWLPAEPLPGANLGSIFCIHCGLRYDVEQNFAMCPKCKNTLPDRSATVGKACSSCRQLNLLFASFCEYCGQKMPAEKAPEQPDEVNPEAPSKGWWTESRMFRLFNKSANPQDLAQQNADLLAVLLSAIQDVAVIKELLQEKGVWDETLYKELRLQRMIGDHSSIGPSPWTSYSYFPYTLVESAFLRHQFKASDEEVKEFEEQAQAISECT
jgi:hypothetical protein